jgi:hypothetical protein
MTIKPEDALQAAVLRALKSLPVEHSPTAAAVRQAALDQRVSRPPTVAPPPTAHRLPRQPRA